jgi:hypothetical protein
MQEADDQSVLVKHRRDRLKLKKKLAQLNTAPEQAVDFRQVGHERGIDAMKFADQITFWCGNIDPEGGTDSTTDIQPRSNHSP